MYWLRSFVEVYLIRFCESDRPVVENVPEFLHKRSVESIFLTGRGDTGWTQDDPSSPDGGAHGAGRLIGRLHFKIHDSLFQVKMQDAGTLMQKVTRGLLRIARVDGTNWQLWHLSGTMRQYYLPTEGLDCSMLDCGGPHHWSMQWATRIDCENISLIDGPLDAACKARTYSLCQQTLDDVIKCRVWMTSGSQLCFAHRSHWYSKRLAFLEPNLSPMLGLSYHWPPLDPMLHSTGPTLAQLVDVS
jgi:hypothetical protein